MTTPAFKQSVIKPWVLVIVIVGLYFASSIMLEAIGLNGTVGKSSRPMMEFSDATIDPSCGSTPQQMKLEKCNETHFLTTWVPDRLGAQMSEYATLLIHSQRLRMIPFFQMREKQMLSAIFRWGNETWCAIMPEVLYIPNSNISILTWEELEEQGISMQSGSRQVVHEWVTSKTSATSRASNNTLISKR